MTTTLVSALDTAARTAGEREFLRTDGESRTFRELAERSRRIAAGLAARGLRPGDRVAVAGPNSIEWLEFLFGATRLGLVVVTLNVRYRETELAHMLDQSGTRLVLASARIGETDLRALYRRVADRVDSLEHVCHFGDEGPDGFEALVAEEGVDGAGPAPHDPAVILYTSGTTGAPKGAVLTHASILAAAAAQVDRLGFTDTDVMLGVMPLNHVGGLTCTVVSSLLAGGTVVLPSGFSPSGVVDGIAAGGVSVFAGVPTMWSRILTQPALAEQDMSSLRVAVVGGSNAEPALCEAIAKGFPGARLSNLYGLSETSGAIVLSAEGDDLAAVARTLGTPLRGVETRVVGSDGEVVGPGADGELQVRGPAVAAGYWDAPTETAATFLPDGWLTTGDVVAADADGHLVLRGRSKEMFLQGGYNVYPVEVENVLARFPGVAMAAGIGVPDADLGEVGHYFVSPVDPDAGVDVDALLAHCREQLADYKVPRRIEVVAALPQTPTGKIAKAELRDRVHPS